MKPQWTELCDELGPARIALLHDPSAELRAIVVVDNVAAGPAIGGVRMAPDVTLEEVFRLGRAMTLKNAAAGLPHGGGKAGIIADPGMDSLKKERLIRAFARAIADMHDYIPGPDMGTDERSMALVIDEIGRAVGLPRVFGGIPLDEIGATGLGLAVCAEAAQEHAGIRLDGARVAIQGFGAVGRHAARFLAARGARVVAVADSRGAVHDPDGLDVAALIAHKAGGRPVGELAGGAPLPLSDLVGVECEIWIPAARPDALTEDNVGRLRARLVLPGANIPATPGAERWLHEHGVLMIPDFIANAGGVICAAVEHHGGSETAAGEAITERIGRNTRELLGQVRERGLAPRDAAVSMARARIAEAGSYRRKGLPAPPAARPLDL